MTQMYLLWEWSGEREGKILHGIYSTAEKAKGAAELDYKENGDHDDLPEGTWNELEWGWHEVAGELVGNKMGEYESDYPYEITPFEVDTFEIFRYGPGTDNPTREKFTL